MISHTAPEGALSGLMGTMTTTGTEAIVFSAYFAAWVAPIFAVLVLGAERQPIRRLLVRRSATVEPS
jgi:hypothetical protein